MFLTTIKLVSVRVSLFQAPSGRVLLLHTWWSAKVFGLHLSVLRFPFRQLGAHGMKSSEPMLRECSRAPRAVTVKAEVRRSFTTTTVRDQSPRSHHKGATGRVRTGDHGIQFYAIANLDKTSLIIVQSPYRNLSTMSNSLLHNFQVQLNKVRCMRKRSCGQECSLQSMDFSGSNSGNRENCSF